jgi:hypothetical protein
MMKGRLRTPSIIFLISPPFLLILNFAKERKPLLPLRVRPPLL